MRVEVKPENVFTKTADSRGRITLGAEFANQEIEVAIVSEDD
ncbi:hypothetical protein [Halobacterium salinarum]|nr:hypothetical protein [Halobacterium salinarum]MDL0133572.1 hypothetical protein [Halobacterium salinarum]